MSDYGYDETLHAFDKSAGKPVVSRIEHLASLLEAAEVADPGLVPIGGITFYRDKRDTSTLGRPLPSSRSPSPRVPLRPCCAGTCRTDVRHPEVNQAPPHR